MCYVFGFVELSLYTVYGQCLQLDLYIHSNVIPGCYKAVCMVYENVNFGWSDYRNGFLVELSLCNVAFYINFTNAFLNYSAQSLPWGGGEGLSPSCPALRKQSCVPQGNTCSLPDGSAPALAVLTERSRCSHYVELSLSTVFGLCLLVFMFI